MFALKELFHAVADSITEGDLIGHLRSAIWVIHNQDRLDEPIAPDMFRTPTDAAMSDLFGPTETRHATTTTAPGTHSAR
jgi:non-ribosomal peptide synthetase component F